MRVLLLAAMLVLCAPAFATTSEALWERYFQEAEQALEQRNYLEAKKIFHVSLVEAERCQQDLRLAARLETLAQRYAAAKRPRVAEALRKLALRIFARKGRSHQLDQEQSCM